MPVSLMERFLTEEADEHVRDVLQRELRRGTSGSRYLTFNIFNVRLDFDRGVATLEDELDPQSEETMALEAFERRLSEA